VQLSRDVAVISLSKHFTKFALERFLIQWSKHAHAKFRNWIVAKQRGSKPVTIAMDNKMLQRPIFSQSSSNKLLLSIYEFPSWAISLVSSAISTSRRELTLRCNYCKIQRFSTSSSLSAISFGTMATTFNIEDAEAGKRINRSGMNGFCSKAKDNVMDFT
jgi:hypothetical protein